VIDDKKFGPAGIRLFGGIRQTQAAGGLTDGLQKLAHANNVIQFARSVNNI
jgi:hypothetical protein